VRKKWKYRYFQTSKSLGLSEKMGGFSDDGWMKVFNFHAACNGFIYRVNQALFIERPIRH
jgi:hypothetical protein